MNADYARLYGLIGYPLGHSFSQNYFNQKFAAEHIDASYVNFEIPQIDMLPSVIAQNPNLRGLNVTIPYKEQVIAYLDDIDDNARSIGAVNVIKFINRADRKMALVGYNSDVVGFTDSIRPLLRPHMQRALILGTGGASKAVRRGLQLLGVDSTPVSRSPRQGVLTYDDLTADIIATHHIIVNTTPLGMYPHVDKCPDIPYYFLTPQHLCYDLLYNPDVTLFMKKSQQYGATVKNGLEMLLLQAFASWQIWHSL